MLGQAVCGRCQTFVPEYDERRFTEGVAVGQQVSAERQASDHRVQALEARHLSRAWFGVLFWIVVLFVALGVGVVLLFGSIFLAV